MNNKLKRVLMLLFVVSTLLLIIGSVSAQTNELNENLEASLGLDGELSVDADNSISNPDNKVSNQLTISNDVETDTSQSIDEDGNDLNSNDVVSNEEDTTINTKDSDKNIKTANQLGDPEFTLVVKPLNESVNIGEIASFEVLCYNSGDDGFSGAIPIYMQYSEDELGYSGYTLSTLGCTVDVQDVPHFMFDQKLFNFTFKEAFNAGALLNFTINYVAKKAGTPGNYIFVDTLNHPGVITTTTVIDPNPNFIVENVALNQSATIGDMVSFVISVRNTGAPVTDGSIPIYMQYKESELAYAGFIPSISKGNIVVSNVSHEMFDQKLFNYTFDGTFGTGDSFNFTVNFIVSSFESVKPGTFVIVDAANKPNAIATTTLDSYFTIELKALNNTINPGASGNVNLGGTASYEVFVRNIGGNYEGVVPIDVYFNPDELEYAGFTPGVNPDAWWIDFSQNYRGPLNVSDGHLLFGYDGGIFEKGHCLNFTVNFITKKIGTVVTSSAVNWTQGKNYQVTASNSTIVGQDADFVLEYKPSALIVNVNDIVSYDVIVTNAGGNYYGWVGIDILYNPEELQYVNFTPNFNPENYDTHDDQGNPTDNPIDLGNGHLYFGYMATPTLENGHVFNFTVNFKPIKAGEDGKKFMSDASIDWWQIDHHYVNSSAYVFATDADFVLDIVSNDGLLQVGDTATFEVTAHNREGSYYGSYIGFDLYYDSDELQYLSFNVNEKPDGIFNLESSPSTVGQSTNGRLFLINSPSDDPGHLRFGYTPSERLTATGDANADCSFNFTVKYTVKSTGLLENEAELTWANSADQKAYASAAVAAGEYAVILNKTAVKEQVSIGDEVAFIVYLENTGTAPIFNRSGYIQVDDWYPGELEYNGYTVNPDSSSTVTVSKESGKTHLFIRQSIGSDGWAPGSVLNVTLNFTIKEKGVHCNHVFFNNMASDYGSVIVEEPKLNLTKDVQEHYVDLDDIVYFDIFVQNLEESIPYYDHYNYGQGGLGVKDLIIHDIYDEGLEYVGFKVNDYNQSGSFSDRNESGNNVSIIFVPDEDRWWPGSWLNITVMFKATKVGNFTNYANVYWRWKDWEPIEEIDLWDDDWVVVGTPDFALEKISNFETAKVGDTVSFTIIYTNNGTRTLTGVYIIDNEYSQGLEYLDYSDKELWTFDGKDKWTYNADLEPGDAATLEIFFKATSTGQKNNTAVAGNNEMDETKNSTDIVLIKDKELDSPEESDEPDGSEDEPDETDDTPTEDEVPETENVPTTEGTPQVSKTVTLPVVGNPLFVLLLCLLSLCFVPLRSKK